MKKDAFYFPHFSNARNDAKLIKVRRVLGIEGYGIYFMLLEVLREQTRFRFPIAGIEDLAYEWHVSKEKIFAVIKEFELFEIDSDEFFSANLIYYLQPYLEKTKRAQLAAWKRWDNANADANADANAMRIGMQVKESKVKESKVKETTPIGVDIPAQNFDFDFVSTQAQMAGLSEKQAEEFYHHYQAQGWVYGTGVQITDVKSAAIKWRNNQHKHKQEKSNESISDYAARTRATLGLS